jgi:hypothetical protein
LFDAALVVDACARAEIDAGVQPSFENVDWHQKLVHDVGQETASEILERRWVFVTDAAELAEDELALMRGRWHTARVKTDGWVVLVRDAPSMDGPVGIPIRRRRWLSRDDGAGVVPTKGAAHEE